MPRHHVRPRRLRSLIAPVSEPLRLAVLCAALAAAWPVMAPAQSAAAQTDTRAYAIPPGALGDVLVQFASAAGVQLIFNPEMLAGRSSPGLNGQFDVQSGVDRLLAGSGYRATRRGADRYVLEAAPEDAAGREVVTLPSIRVTGRALSGLDNVEQEEGSAADGYRTRTITSMGALGGMNALDAPYAVNTVSQDLIQNIQAQSPDDVYKISPSTLSQVPQLTGWAPMVKIRGFSSYDRAEDGLRNSFGFAAVLEDKERVEVLNGLSGFLFGAAAPGGMVNYVSKRPTQERLNRLTLGNYGGSQYYVHGDFGGRFDSEGKFGYRLNLARQKGDTAVDDQKIDRSLASLALDWRPTDRLKVEFDASYNDYEMQAPTAYWTFREGVPRIQAPDASKNWGQPWVRDKMETKSWKARAVYQANDHLTLRFAHARIYQDRPTQDHTMNSVRSPTEYYQIRIHSGRTKTEAEATQMLADLSFDTGSIGHKVTVGYYGHSSKSWGTSYSPNTGYLGPNGFDSPTHVPVPAWPADPGDSMYFSGKSNNANFIVGDLVRFNEQWSALVGVNHSRIASTGRSPTGDLTQPDYRRSRNSPNVSVIYKPRAWLTAYATYIEGLEEGGFAPLEADNRLTIMPPMVSRQKEVGAKAELGGVLVSGALFDIEKANEFLNTDNVYTQDGRQQHRGAEISAFGKPTPAWTIVGGATMLTAKVKGGDYDGKAPMNVPKFMAKLYSEYALPFAPGLSVTGGIYHVGKQWAMASNSSRLPSYTTFDLGLRYATKLSGRPLSLRLTVNNVADRSYWLNSYYLGSPRSVAVSAQMAF